MLVTNPLIPIKILIVEDESIVAADIKDTLEALEYHVPAIADSGKLAIEKTAETQPNLVLIDTRLKGKMNGVQAAKQIWSRFNIPIVYLTAHSDIDTLKRAKTTEQFGYITKPVKERELHTAIEIALHQHQLERKLKAREQWLETILTSIGDAIIATDDKNCITWLNPVAEVLTGWKQSEALGKNSTEVFKLVDEETYTPLPNLTKTLQSKVVATLPEQKLLIAKNGREIPIDDSTTLIKDDQGEITGTVLVFRDVSERKEAEKIRLALEQTQQLEMQMAELKRLNQLKDDFLSTVSHELRTPMTNIKMAVKMLELVLAQSSTSLPQTAQPATGASLVARYLQILNDESRREIELINKMLELQRLEADCQPLSLDLIHLPVWLTQLIEPFQASVQEHQQTLLVDAANLSAIVVDSTSLRRILIELLHNACKYTPSGEQIKIIVRTTQGILRLQVSNSGVEIPASELPQIFNKFYRIPNNDPWKQGGTGLGLALVHKLVEHLQGSIEVESSQGWTQFTIELPIQPKANK